MTTASSDCFLYAPKQVLVSFCHLPLISFYFQASHSWNSIDWMDAGRGNTKERGYGDLYNGAYCPLRNHAFCLYHQEDYWPLIVLAIIVSGLKSCENNLFIRCFYKLSSWMLRGAAPSSSNSAGCILPVDRHELLALQFVLHFKLQRQTGGSIS